MPAFCQHCGQEIHNIRYGVNLSPSEVKIFDLVQASPGIERGDIAARLNIAKKTVSVHVFNINAKLEPEHVRIANTLGYAVKRFGGHK